MAAAFSRVQLAAALLEYDNDPENPEAPNRFAHESAIFLPLRQNVGNKPWVSRKNDQLQVPHDAATSAKSVRSNSALDHRQSRASISTLQNPFGPDEQLEDENENNEEEDLEVDLASWGLDAFMPKDKSAKNGKGKAKSNDLVPAHPVSQVQSHHPLTSHDTPKTAPKRALGASRSMSVGGNLEYFGAENGLKPPHPMEDNRRRSISSPLETFGMDQPQIMERRRTSSYTGLSTQAASSLAPHSVPFPTAALSVRSLSPNPNEAPGFQSSALTPRSEHIPLHRRAQSSASMDLNILADDVEQNSDRKRVLSNATMATLLLEDNPFALRPPSRASRFDPKAAAHARTMSNASLGSRVLLDNDDASIHTSQVLEGREHRYSTTMDLLRPKVLIMPSPLQPSAPPQPSPDEKVREGFQLSTDGPPLPPGARSSRRLSAAFSMMETPPLTSSPLTPNSTAVLSLSQKTFRSTLWTADEHSAYMDTGLPRATVDGEQAQISTEMEEPPIVSVIDVEGPGKTSRPAGKLFGKSLIDDLEERKAQMRSKQRVFYGDKRPSMMARTSTQRSSTLIDPAALQSRPATQRMSSFGSQDSKQALGRRNSANIKPLLNFDEEDKSGPGRAPGSRLPQGRSVFGVDTLWEREMSKLKEIEAQEKREEEERRSREEAEETKKKKKKKGKSKGKPKIPSDPQSENLAPETAPQPRVSVEPPVLPDIPRAGRRPPPQAPDDDSESDESMVAGTDVQRNQPSDPHWHAVSSDEEDEPVRTTGTGPRFPVKQRHHKTMRSSDSEEDVPLSIAISRVAQNHTLAAPVSDDERPLSSFIRKKQSDRSNAKFDSLPLRIQSDEDEDNMPLGLRTSRLIPSPHNPSQMGDDDDDRPLGLHPEQQRRSQFHIIAQQQQQQQQLMMQAQMQNSMYFPPPSMIGTPFFNSAMMPMIAQAPMPIPSPPPVHDQVKYNIVDSWRRGVAVEGEP